MRIRSVNFALALLCAAMPALPAASAASADEARVWIKRMSEAVVQRNYDGVLEHSWAGGGSEALRITHRWRDGQMSERIAFLGSSYEITRNGTQYVEIDRRKGVAKAQTLTRSYGYLSAFNGISADSDKYYEIRKGGVQRLQGYPGQTQMITVVPRDDLRYGYRFWLDQQSALPIMTQLVTASGQVIDTTFFQSLTLPETIDDELLKPALSAKQAQALHWVTTPKVSSTAVKQVFLPRASLLPPGFRKLNINVSDAKGMASGSENRFIVSDGINWVSVAVTVADKPQNEGLRKVSATAFLYVLRLDGHHISVGGEVPPATVKSIAEAVRPE
ncbi:MAG: MucB/RseB C-terminal domain-containing protein [Steroidobacteraceae bacterium]